MSTSTTIAVQPDLAAVKQRQQQVWASADYAAVAARIMPMAEGLAQAAGLRAGERVLDVATGSGNAALAAARCGCQVTGVDYVPALLERGRARAAAELVRVCRPGGTIGLVNWTPSGFIGQLLRTVGKHVPPPPGVRPPTQWGTEERLRELLGGAVSRLEIRHRAFVFRFRSADDFAAFFRDNYGPVHKAFGALDEAGGARFYDDLTALAREHDQEEGPSVAMPAAYLEVVATRA
jgi:hypothetical protein